MILNNENWYFALLAFLFQTRRNGGDEDSILAIMDTLWYALDEASIDRVNAMSQKLADHTISEEEFTKFYVPSTALPKIEINRSSGWSHTRAATGMTASIQSSDASYSVADTREAVYA